MCSNSPGLRLDKAKETAEEIDRTFTEYRGTDTPRFDFIGLCCSRNYALMKATFEEYEKVALIFGLLIVICFIQYFTNG